MSIDIVIHYLAIHYTVSASGRRRKKMDKGEKTYTIELTEEEVRIVHDVFNELSNESLEKWTTLIPQEGEYRSQECYQQWLTTGKFHSIRMKSGCALEQEKSHYNRREDGSGDEKKKAAEVFGGFLK